MLSQLNFVDYIVAFDEDTPLEVIKKIKPCVIAKGGDYKKSDIVGSDIVAETIISNYIKNESTTNIIKKLQT